MQILVSIIFWLFLNIWSTIIPIIFTLPSLLFRSTKIADFGAKIWAVVLMWVLKYLCGIDYQIIGKKNIPNEPCVIACKHQSMWETAVMHLVLHRPVYLYKKELLKIPFYGWFLNRMSGVAVNRKGGAKALKNVIDGVKKFLNANQSIVIFPQGTRVPINGDLKKYPYQIGVTAIYNACGVKVVPAALNSGVFWSKKKIFTKRGTILLEFLPPIEPGLAKEDFNQRLSAAIEDACKKMPSH